jgi:hypothetical protein
MQKKWSIRMNVYIRVEMRIPGELDRVVDLRLPANSMNDILGSVERSEDRLAMALSGTSFEYREKVYGDRDRLARQLAREFSNEMAEHLKPKLVELFQTRDTMDGYSLYDVNAKPKP